MIIITIIIIIVIIIIIIIIILCIVPAWISYDMMISTWIDLVFKADGINLIFCWNGALLQLDRWNSSARQADKAGGPSRFVHVK